MEKSEQSGRTRAIREYLAGIGSSISNVQAHEVLARALGLKNKHVLAGTAKSFDDSQAPPRMPSTTTVVGDQVVRVLPLGGEPFSVPEMDAMNWVFDFVVPVDLDYLGDIEAMNDHVSNRLTGCDSALEDISFKHLPGVNYGEGWVAFRVTGHVSSPENHFEGI